MKLEEYKYIVENEIGKVTLPTTNEEIENILESLEEHLGFVSNDSYNLLQAIEIVINWRNNIANIGTETHPDNQRY